MFHFIEDLQYLPVSSFSLTIFLWIVRGRPSMLDVICLSQVPHVLIYEWGPIVTNQYLVDPKPCNDVLSNEVYHGCPSGLFQRDGLYPFRKILGGYQDPYMAVRGKVFRPYKIKSPSLEKPQCCHIL